MLGKDFFHDTLKSYIAVFGQLFEEINVFRTDANNVIVQTMHVPITYGPQEKFLARETGDPALNRPFAIDLPRMSFEIADLSYDGDRKIHTTNQVRGRSNTGYVSSLYSSVPYNIDFNLYVMVKEANDGVRIVEQILPYFTPDFTISMFPLKQDFPTYSIDVPIILNSVRLTDNYDQDFITRRTMVWTLGFTMKSQFFGPVAKAKVIKKVFVNFITNWDTKTPIEIETVQPGLTANGQPTANVAESIPFRSIQETDNYGIIETITDPE